MDKKQMLQAELLELDGKLNEMSQIEKPGKADLLRVNATCDRIEAIQTELRALALSEPEPRFAEDTRSQDERLHRIGKWLQAAAASTCGDPGRRFGEFRAGVYRRDILDAERRSTGMEEATPSLGGFLTQTTLAGEVLRRVEKTAVLWPLTRRMKLGENSNGVKVPYIDETARTAGARMGGIQGYWLEEGGEKTASKPKFGSVELILNKCVGLAYATDELLQDAGALAEIIVQGFSDELSFKLDEAVIRGTGAGQPLGLLNAPCLIPVTGAGTVDTIVAADITAMWSRLFHGSRANAVWIINSDCLPMLMAMNSDTAASTGCPLWLPANQLGGSPYTTLLGRRVIESEHCSEVGTLGDVFLADLAQYLTVEKPMQVASSIHVSFTSDQTVYRFVSRNDGQPWWSSALTPAHGSTTVSPFVTLATR